ncbi:cell division protein ZipA [Thalassotalea euphylliae]|uniref:cell division protein ZipA n=1 Tax=Thalassotalea euphylliae TaxID=1655234 RepID=UPI0036274446
MEDNFRNALIIISALVIAAIFIHGLWTIRKNKNPYKLKTSNSKVEPLTRDFDSSGFDQDGVSEPRVIKPTALTGEIDNPPEENEIPDQPAPAPTFNDEPLPCDLELTSEPMPEPVSEALSTEQPPMPPADVPVEAPVVEEKPLYDEPVIHAKPKSQVNAAKSKKAKKDSLKKNQIELDFDLMSEQRKEPSIGGADSEPALKKTELETEVLVLSVVMSQGQVMSGAALLPSLLTLGMKFGDMDIFHRHQDNAGNGKVTFSLANMMNPGTFDLDNMENFTTQGVSLFMTMPNAGDAFEVFEQMLAAAKQLAQEFNAQVLDDKRSVMTKQTEQHYVGRIREYERKSRIANA